MSDKIPTITIFGSQIREVDDLRESLLVDARACDRDIDDEWLRDLMALQKAMERVWLRNLAPRVAAAISERCAKYEGKPVRYKRVQKAVSDAISSVASDLDSYIGMGGVAHVEHACGGICELTVDVCGGYDFEAGDCVLHVDRVRVLSING